MTSTSERARPAGRSQHPAPLHLAIVGAVLAAAGLVSAVVLFLQPWRSCMDDDSPAGCPATQLDGYLVMGALAAFLAGLVLLILSLVRLVSSADSQ